MKRYFYSDGERQFGPYDFEELREEGIEPDTLVWHPGLDSWIPASESDELKRFWEEEKKPVIDLPDEEVPEVFNPEMYRSGSTDHHTTVEKPPKNWLLESILVTLLCCNPLGIVAIVYAAQVDTLFYKGEKEKSHKNSRNAAMWTRVAFAISLFLFLFYFFSVMMALFFGS